MSLKKHTTSLFGTIILLGLATSANAVLIDFDSHAATTQYFGTPPASSVVTDDYASLGVVFGKAGVSAGVAVVDNFNTFSTPNGACALDASGNFIPNCAGDIYFNFVDQTNSSKLAVTDAVSFYIGDSGGDLDLWTINVFDIVGNLLDSRDVASNANINVAFNYAGMHSFEILDTSGNTLGYLLDNLSFNSPTSTVPEPSTILLMMVGLAGIGFTRRKS